MPALQLPLHAVMLLRALTGAGHGQRHGIAEMHESRALERQTT